MKKIFAILAIVGFMVACNNKSEKKTETTDTTKMEDNKMMDTTNTMMDTTKSMDTTSKMQ